ncbi:GerAB/ArcD/ProY family transporter [Paenibacillus macerans]|uniref:GerAB/ArcD/ProY family transporter n=1 Tax=Paenibacillus macerans TaxID=44252 RepID=UPI003D31A535
MRVTRRQIILISILHIFSITYLQTFAPMSETAHQHAILSYAAGGLVCLLALWFISAALKRFTDKNLIQAVTERFPVFGRALLALYLLFLLFIAARDIRIVADFTNSVLLNRTPVLILGLLITATAVYITQGGIRAFLGLSEIYGAITVIMMAGVALVLLQNIHLKYLMPYFSFDWPGIVKGAWYAVPYLGEIIMLPMVISGKFYKASAGYLGLAIGTGLLLTNLFLAQTVMGVPLTSKLIHPGYEMVRQITVTDFMDRFDLIVMALWYPTALGKIGFDLYVLCYTLQWIVPKLSGRLMTAPAGALAFVCSIWFFKNSLQQFNFNYVWPLIALIFELVLPFLFFLLLRPRRVKPKSG